MTQPRSNGQTEGQINKLRLVKRQMYGPTKIDPLQARPIGAAWNTADHHRDCVRPEAGPPADDPRALYNNRRSCEVGPIGAVQDSTKLSTY
jgi:hypothetical protein